MSTFRNASAGQVGTTAPRNDSRQDFRISSRHPSRCEIRRGEVPGNDFSLLQGLAPWNQSRGILGSCCPPQSDAKSGAFGKNSSQLRRPEVRRL